MCHGCDDDDDVCMRSTSGSVVTSAPSFTELKTSSTPSVPYVHTIYTLIVDPRLNCSRRLCRSSDRWADTYAGRVACCLPGETLSGVPKEGQVEGRDPKTCDIIFIARSANLPEGLYILPMFFLHFYIFIYFYRVTLC